MLAWSLNNPYALLAAAGLKRIETRGCMVNHRGPTAIYATLSFPLARRAVCHDEPFRSALRGLGFEKPDELPTGAVVGVVNVADCHRIRDGNNLFIPTHWPGFPVGAAFYRTDEYRFGIYQTGRTMTLLEGARLLPRFVPARAPGQQMFWTLPDEVEREVRSMVRVGAEADWRPQKSLAFGEV